MKSIFITGITGYIGGAIAYEILKQKDRFKVSALVRTQAQADELVKLGVEPIQGSLQDSQLLKEVAKKSDIVISAADADHLPSVQSLVQGLLEKNDKNAIFIHTSGTGLLTYHNGPYEEVHDDNNLEDIHKRIPQSALHKNVDQWIFDNTEGKLMMAIIAPSTINGIGQGHFKKTSQQVINLIKIAVVSKHAGYVNPQGYKSRWNNVHITDLADLYMLVLNGLINQSIDHGKSGFYFGISHEHTWGRVAELIGQELYKHGLVESKEIKEVEQQYVDKYFGGNLYRFAWTDSRGVANRSHKIGWHPHHPNVYETIPEEVTFLINHHLLE